MRKLLYALPLAMLSLAGCEKPQVVTGFPTVLQEGLQTEENHKRLVAATPAPQFERSLERENLVARLKRMNVQNKVMYINCVGLNGNVVYSGQVKGKPSSLNSLLTTNEQIVRVVTNQGGATYMKMPSPDFDGSYGKNPEGIFWFDPSGAYFEWSGSYFLSDRPMKLNVPVSLTTNLDVEK